MNAVKIRIEYGRAKSADPWNVLPEDVRAVVNRGLTDSGEVANLLAQQGWRLVSVVSTGDNTQDMYLQKDA